MEMLLNISDPLSFHDTLSVDIQAETDALIGELDDFYFFDSSPLEFDDLCSRDEENPIITDRNVIMPILYEDAQSPAFKESHLRFSPAAFKLATNNHYDTTPKRNLFNNFIQEEKPACKTVTEVTPIFAESDCKSGKKEPIMLTLRSAIRRETSATLVPESAPVLSPVSATVSDSVPSPVSIFESVSVSAPVSTSISAAVSTSVSAPKLAPISASVSADTNVNGKHTKIICGQKEQVFPKPTYSYSCLAGLALKNSRAGRLPVRGIYKFICKHFPYFKTASRGWKNCVRHSLCNSQNFEKIVRGDQRKGCLWTLKPAKIRKMDEEIQKLSRNDSHSIKRSMAHPEDFDALQSGKLKFSRVYDDTDDSGNSEDGSDDGSNFEKRHKIHNSMSGECVFFNEGDIGNVVVEVSTHDEEVRMEVSDFWNMSKVTDSTLDHEDYYSSCSQ